MELEKVDTVHLAEADPRNLPLAFPGREVLQLPRIDGKQRRAVNSGNVMVYGSLPNTGGGGVARLNLFAELFGIREHVASAFIVAGDPPASIINVSGHVVDSWHLLVQTSGADARPRVAMASQDCCGEPQVRVNKANLNRPPPPTGESGPKFTLEMLDPAMVPWGRENGQYNLFNDTAEAGPVTFTLDAGARVTRIEVIADGGGATVAITDRLGFALDSFIVPADQQVELFVRGDLAAASVTYTGISYITVETVR